MNNVRADSIKTHKGADIVLGFWLIGVFAAGLLTKIYALDSFNPKIIVTICVLWPLMFFALSRSFIPRLPSTDRLVVLCIFTIFGGLSVCVSADAWESFTYFLMTLAAFFISLQFNTNLQPEQFERGLKFYSIISTVILIWYAMFHYKTGIRLGDEIKSFGSNAVAVMSVSIILASAAIRTIIIRYLVMAPGIVILYLTGSRTSAIFMLVSLFIILVMRIKSLTILKKSALMGLLLIFVAVAAFYSDIVLHHSEKFFAVHDKWRGIGTGATGRQFAWRATWKLFLSSPIIGVGFRAHEHLIKIASSSHNGYLALLAEIGAFGFISAVYLILSGIKVLWKNSKDPKHAYLNTLLFGFCFGYLLLGIFERYLFNIGNATSLLFMLGIMGYKLNNEDKQQQEVLLPQNRNYQP